MATFLKAVPVKLGSRQANENMRAGLRRLGEIGDNPCTVLHYAYPRQDTGPKTRARVVRELQERGFDVRDSLLRNGLVLRHETAVTSARFDWVTEQVAALLDTCDWDYDGWECLPAVNMAVVSSGALTGHALQRAG